MMTLTNDVIVRCLKCGKIHFINKDYFECNEYWDDGEREMGYEVNYSFDYDLECNCNNIIIISIEAWEYPIGMFNFEDFFIKGGEYVVNPTCEVVYEFFDYDDSELDEIQDKSDYLRNQIENMSPREFEEYVANYFQEEGYEIFLTPKTRDGGYDIICKKNIPSKIVLLVECKRYSKDNKVGVKIVREVYGTKISKNVNQAIIVTSSSFTKDAKAFANGVATSIELVDLDEFLSWIQK